MAKIIDEEYWDNLKEPTKLMSFLSKLLKTPKTSTVLITIGVSIAAFFWSYFLVILTTEDFLLSLSAYGQLNLEFGGTAQIVDSILTAWGTEGSTRVVYAIIANFVIMASYIFIFIGLIILATRQFKEKRKIQDLFLKMIFLPILAGIVNTIGNLLMIIMLSSGSSVSPVLPFITSICGIIKYMLIVSSLVIFIVEIVVFVIIYIKEHR